MVEYKANREDCEMYVSLHPRSYIGLHVNKVWGKVINVLKELKVFCFVLFFKKIFFHEFYRLLVLILASEILCSLENCPAQGNQPAPW